MVSVLEPLEKYKNNGPFDLWLKDFEDFVLANFGEVNNKRKKAILMQLCGEEVKKYADSLDDETKVNYTKLTDVLKDKFSHLANETIERHIFNTMVQEEGELIDSFVIRLQTQAKKCNYKVPPETTSVTVNDEEHPVVVSYADITNSLIRDRIVVGISNQPTKTRLLRDHALTLESAVTIVKAQELADERVSTLQDSFSVNSLNQKRKRSFQPNYNPQQKPQINSNDSVKRSKTRATVQNECGYCGRIHQKGKCPAFGETCGNCNRKNHFARVCRFKNVDLLEEDEEHYEVEGVYYAEEKENLTQLNIGMIVTNSTDGMSQYEIRKWIEQIYLSGKKVSCKIDTGAECNVISKKVLDSIEENYQLCPNRVVVKAYGGKELPILGTTYLVCELYGTKIKAKFHVVPFNAATVISLDTSVKLNLANPKISHTNKQCHQLCIEEKSLTTHKDLQIHHADSETQSKSYPQSYHQKINEVKNQFSEVFNDNVVGCLDDKGCRIKLKEGAVPVQHPARRIAFSIMPAAKQELERMVSLKVIEKVEEPTEWVNSMVIVKEPNKLRVCLDPTELNQFVMREHSHIPTPEETFSQIGNAKFFTKLDLKNGYWQIPLDEKSSYLTTFNTPFGRFRYLRLPFGLNSANEIFQKKMTQRFEGIPGVLVMFDDILITSETFEKHLEQLKLVFQRCSEIGIKLNESKCKFLCDRITYIGHVITPNGVEPNPERVRAIEEMPAPTSKKDVQRFLGMVTYLARYAPNLSELTQPLRILLHKENEFVWSHEQEKAFSDIKEVLTRDALLAHFDSKKTIEIHTDASLHGLGACLIQDSRPVAYASRSLTPTEKRYANIEKELLSVVFGLERFNQFVYGQHVKVFTDHKPLVPISNKNIVANPARCQRLLLRLQKYDFDLIYKKGKDHVIPDTLSRAALMDTFFQDEELEKECELNVHMIVKNNIKYSDEMMIRLIYETASDACTSKMMDYVINGWPQSVKECNQAVTCYWPSKDNISCFEGLLLFHDRIIIPKALQGEILQRIHSGHQGRVRSKALARQAVFWTNINADIDNVVNKCEQCLKTRKLPGKVKMEPHEVPTRPFEKVGADIVTVFGTKYQVVVDYFSKWIDLQKLPNNPVSSDVIDHFIDVFSRFGFPNVAFSDREQIYKSRELNEFCKKYGISKEFSSSFYSQSNGQVERAIGHTKNLIKRCNGNLNEVKLALLDYHATPLDSNLASPHCILMNRKLRTNLPLIESNLITPNDKINRNLLVDRQSKGASYYNRTGRESFVTHKPGDVVVYSDGKGQQHDWKKAKVMAVDEKFRAYSLLNRNGNIITRNRAHILPDKTGNGFQASSDGFLDPVYITPQPNNPHLVAKKLNPKTPINTTAASSNRPPSETQPTITIPNLEVPKTTILPNELKELKLREYAKNHNTTVMPTINLEPRRSVRLAAKRLK